MATKILRFRGHPHVKPGHVWPTPPLAGPVHVNAAGKSRHGLLPGDEIVFDRALAQQYNRVCACHGDGECWAYQHAGVWQPAGHPPIFDVLDVPAEQSDEVPANGGADSDPAGDGLDTSDDPTEPTDAVSGQTDDPVQPTAPPIPQRRRTQTARNKES